MSRSTNTELLCKVKYLNNLPDIPFDPKFISYPFEPTRFIQYKSTSLEKNYKWDILNEQDMGVQIDLINPDTHKIDQNGWNNLSELIN
jgi:RNA polymerase II-associated factor 1